MAEKRRIADLTNQELLHYKQLLDNWFTENEEYFMRDWSKTAEWSLNQRKRENIEAELNKRNI